jgi:hypothetical protein
MKFKAGMVAGMLSGAEGCTVASHNRYGTYFRMRVKPIVSQTSLAIATRANFTANSMAWRSLSPANRLAWAAWAHANPVIDRLGDSQILTGNAAYLGLNARLYKAGIAVITAPPVVAHPAPLTLYTQTYDIGAGAFAATFTPTPIGAGNSLWVQASVVQSAGITYTKNLMRVVNISAANQATGVDLQSVIEATFGALIVGYVVTIMLSVLDRATGLLSAPRLVQGAVVST